MFVPLRTKTDRTGLELRKSLQCKALRISSAESIVTKRIALGEVAFEELGPSIRVILRFRSKACLHDHVLDRLPRYFVTEPSHGLDDLGVSPASLLTDANNRFADALLDAWPARLGILRFRPLIRRVLDIPHPLAECGIADDGDQLLDASPEFLAVLNQPATLLIAQLDPLG